MPERPNHDWTDDVLERKPIADILTTALAEQSNILAHTEERGITVALDGSWGAGKTFFVKRWSADLRLRRYPTIVFDAWENDVGDETSIALMSTIRQEIDRYLEDLSLPASTLETAKKKLNKAVQSLRRAVLPTSKIIAKGLIRKATGIVVDDLYDSITGDASSISESGHDTFNKSLDEAFNQSLDDHKRKKDIIENFKSDLNEILRTIGDFNESSLPMFIFVDEVDRCKPTYAIKLLEEIKHLFGAPNICFVVSTNFSQLKESICAVYGHGFDGHTYLKRFFDKSYSLPAPDNKGFARRLLSEASSITSRQIITGLPNRPNSPDSSDSVAIIADAMKLDLRSQKQIFALACDVAACLPKDTSIYLLWLYFLCAALHTNPQAFEKIGGTTINQEAFSNACKELIKNQIDIEVPLAPGRQTAEQETKAISLEGIIYKYYTSSKRDLRQILERAHRSNGYEYPENIELEISYEMPGSYPANSPPKPSISKYFELVSSAGIIHTDLD